MSAEHIPIVDMAYEIISMDETIRDLQQKLAHANEINKILKKSLDHSDKTTREMTGQLLKAVMDPDSLINQAAISQAEKE